MHGASALFVQVAMDLPLSELTKVDAKRPNQSGLNRLERPGQLGPPLAKGERRHDGNKYIDVMKPNHIRPLKGNLC
jgi:hypothetical protein